MQHFEKQIKKFTSYDSIIAMCLQSNWENRDFPFLWTVEKNKSAQVVAEDRVLHKKFGARVNKCV